MADKKKKTVHRSEASAEVSEFNLSEAGKEKVKLDDLIRTLKTTSVQVAVKQQLKKASLKKKLEVPLSKPEAERIKRGVAYEKVSKEVTKWDPVVEAIHMRDQIVFPLKKPDFRLETTDEVVKRYQTKNALEEQVSKLLNSSENVLHQDKVLTVAEEKALKAMSLAEAKARHEDLRKIRALLSFKEAKARRQKKIKSKKYHRILKKEKMKKVMKEFEELQKTDPDAAQEKLKEADGLRILERMTLKHKSTGKWAKQQKIRAKYNPESRSALKEQMSISKSLTEKVLPVEESKEDQQILLSDAEANLEQDEDDDLLKLYTLSNLDFVAVESEAMSTPKPVPITMKKVQTPKPAVEVEAPVVDEESEEEDLVEETLTRKRTLEDFENMDNGRNAIEDQIVAEVPKSKRRKKEDKVTVSAEEDPVKPEKRTGAYVSEIDFSTEVKFLESMVPDDVTFGDEGLDSDDEDRMNIKQAFADEDFISEFKEDKKATVNKDKPQGIDLFVPGWGKWGGAGIKTSMKKRRRFLMKPVDVPLRKDLNLPNVIINEEKDKKASVHQVSELPFPFKNVHQFQSAIRHPIGSTWNPETSFQKIIAPKVVTKLGKVIKPIDTDDMIFPKGKGKKGNKKRSNKPPSKILKSKSQKRMKQKKK